MSCTPFSPAPRPFCAVRSTASSRAEALQNLLPQRRTSVRRVRVDHDAVALQRLEQLVIGERGTLGGEPGNARGSPAIIVVCDRLLELALDRVRGWGNRPDVVDIRLMQEECVRNGGSGCRSNECGHYDPVQHEQREQHPPPLAAASSALVGRSVLLALAFHPPRTR